MANRRLLVLESNNKKWRDSAISDFDFLSIKIGESGLEIKEGVDGDVGKLDFGMIDLLNKGGVLLDDGLLGANNGLATLDANGKIPAAQLPNSIMDYVGLWYGTAIKAQYFNDIYVSATPVGQAMFRAIVAGAAGNNIELVFNGTDDIDAVVAAWNSSNPGNEVELVLGESSNVDGDTIPDATSITLFGGHDVTTLLDGGGNNDAEDVGNVYKAFNAGEHTGDNGTLQVAAGDYLILNNSFQWEVSPNSFDVETVDLQSAWAAGDTITSGTQTVTIIDGGSKAIRAAVGEAEVGLELKASHVNGAGNLIELVDSNDNWIGVKIPASITSPYNIMLPGQNGTEGQVMALNASLELEWVDQSGGEASTISALNSTGNTISALTPAVLHSSGEVQALTDASTLATVSGVIILSVAEIEDEATGQFYLPGQTVSGFSGLTPGQFLYLGTTNPGEITATPPSVNGQAIRLLGYAISATDIIFDPEPFAIEIVSE